MTLLAELNVDEISNNQCKQIIEKKLRSLNGVDRFSFNEPERKISIAYDEGIINLVDIKQSIMEEGFAVIEI